MRGKENPSDTDQEQVSCLVYHRSGLSHGSLLVMKSKSVCARYGKWQKMSLERTNLKPKSSRRSEIEGEIDMPFQLCVTYPGSLGDFGGKAEPRRRRDSFSLQTGSVTG